MVGGRIVSIRAEDDRICLIVAAKPYGRHEFMGIDVARTAHPLKLGDSLWWQGDHAYWTENGPDGKASGREDIPIRRVSYSYSVGLTR